MPPDDFSEKIELFVNDENRIISYKILSQELKIHVNKAKQCLLDFFNAQKLKGISLEAHYFVSGFIELNGYRTLKVVVVPEENLENVKKSFIELISSHIYSVCKGASKDECALYSTDFTYIKDKEEQNKYSAIKHPNIDIQPPVLNKIQVNRDINSSLTKKHSPANDNSSLVPKNELKSKFIQSNVSPEKCDNSKEQTKDSKGSNSKASPEDKNQKSGTLMSLWQKKDEKTNGVKKESLKADKKATKVVPKNNIMSMFSKQTVKNAERPPSKDEGTPKTVVSEIKKESPKKETFQETKKASHKRKASHKNSKGSSKSKKDSDSENESQPKAKKKHRRICTFDDSDSESENEEQREKEQRSLFLSEDPMDIDMTPKTEDEEPIPPTPPVIRVKGRVKMWKTVQKTYEDEDGFLVTKTEKELVSASEDEEDPLKVNPIKKVEAVIKKCTSVNKKQASLMSFFRQK